MTNLSKISVIIPAFNAQKTLKDCVNAVLHQDLEGADLEVIVVDDGSTDATADIARSFDRVVYIHQQNSGPAAARNNGARHATGDILCFTDSDCRPQPHWLATIMHYMNDQSTDVVAGSYGITNSDHLLARCVHQEILYRHQQLMGDWIDVFGSYNVAFRREVFERLDGFNESYKNASGEDNDLSYRLKQNGYSIRFAKNAYVDHHHPQCVTKYLQEQFRHGYWRAHLYKTHPVMMKGDGYTFWKDALEVPLSFVLLALLVLMIFGISGKYFWAASLFMVMLESIFACKYGLRKPFENLFFAVVMMARSVARLAGLVLGFLRFSITPNP